MTADVELLPLPEPECMGGNDVFGKEFPLFTTEQAEAYARAVAEYNVENLRRERDAAVYALANTERSLAAARKARDLFADRAEQLAEALRMIANQGPHYGPDGTYKTWRHWADIARAALRDHDQEGGDA